MAEVTNKRNSFAGKVATPKTSSTPVTPATPTIADPMEALGKSIGARIKLTTSSPSAQTYEGTLFTACPILNLVAINTSSTDSATQAGDYHMIPISRIQTFQVLSLANSSNPTTGASAQPAIGPVDIKRLQDRERAKIEKLKEEERNKGKGVSKEGQAIYDSLKRINMPVRWHNKQMIVHDAIIIAPPYRVDDCKGSKDKVEVLNRVKKVLEGERRKLTEKREKEERERKAATPIVPRKGG